MGRARAGKQAVAASANFNTVLGRNRGSALAQTQRDAEERKAYDDELSALESDVGVCLSTALDYSTIVEGPIVSTLSRYFAITPATSRALTRALHVIRTCEASPRVRPQTQRERDDLMQELAHTQPLVDAVAVLLKRPIEYEANDVDGTSAAIRESLREALAVFRIRIRAAEAAVRGIEETLAHIKTQS
jgi:hypothetical protein